MSVFTRCLTGTCYIHDATMCQCCWHINCFYTIFKPALERLYKLNNCSSSSDDYEVCGILTFLEGCFKFGFITNDAKSNISSNANPPDYTPILDSIVNSKKKFNSRPAYSASIRALLYKYKKKEVKTDQTNQSVSKPHDDRSEDSISSSPCKDEKRGVANNERKRSVRKRLVYKCVKDSTPALLNKHKRKARKTDETKLSAPKRRRGKCLKDSTPALLNKHKRKGVKSNKIKRSLKKNHSDDRLQGPASKASKKRSKAPKPKSKKEVANKIPTKGTLKRKRWFVKQMETEENYEDDIFENLPIYRLPQFDEVSQSSNDSCCTPKWEFKLSPRPVSPLPTLDDFNDITDLKMCRKDAEEYQHRRKKRRDNPPKTKPPSTSYNEVKSTSSNEVKKEQSADSELPICDYATLKLPLKDEEYDSEDIPDDYCEEEKDSTTNS